tara:strand:- start:298 stop:885 length:588 start_codon:yes stop_codon:yes gene_type:complete
MNPLYDSDSYMIRQKVLKLFGETFHIYSDESMTQLVGYCKQKAFKLKEDIRIFNDEEQTTELLTIKARSVLDFGATYDIVDATTGESLGALRRKGLKSILKDSWIVLAPGDVELGTLVEESSSLALFRRFLPFVKWIAPQEFDMVLNHGGGVRFTQKHNPFVRKLKINGVKSSGIDPRMVVAAGILLSAIEGRQN